MFHKDVVKVDRNVVMVCCKLLFLMFHMFFSSVFIWILQVCLFGCCICSTHMSQLFYLDVAFLQQF
jgi:hypothetical protein